MKDVMYKAPAQKATKHQLATRSIRAQRPGRNLWYEFVTCWSDCPGQVASDCTDRHRPHQMQAAGSSMEVQERTGRAAVSLKSLRSAMHLLEYDDPSPAHRPLPFNLTNGMSPAEQNKEQEIPNEHDVSGSIPLGSRVVVMDLHSNMRVNGTIGMVVEHIKPWPDATMAVVLDQGDRVCLRSENLSRVCSGCLKADFTGAGLSTCSRCKSAFFCCKVKMNNLITNLYIHFVLCPSETQSESTVPSKTLGVVNKCLIDACMLPQAGLPNSLMAYT